ncbi:MAG: carboxypeptidase regulatory-like domain-containing protein, partial [Caldilineaceae bacterium]|nr:carboxypeptidase regulatory-like domain-containing protein [Caldilineaceae bacterium]
GARSDLVVKIVATCPNANEEPTGAVLKHNGQSYPMYALSSTPLPDFEGVIPAAEVTDGPVEADIICRNTGTGAETTETDRVAEIRLFDPSGFVTDAVTGDPIVGATVTLYQEDGWLPDTAETTRDCRTVETRGFSGWTQAADEGIGMLPDALFIEPDTNPQLTNSEGRYGWDVAAGCWYVTVAASGYFSQTSPVVGVPPEVTDLDIALTPINVSAPKLTIIRSGGSNIQLMWTTNPAYTGFVVHRSDTPFFTPNEGTKQQELPISASSSTHAGVVGDGNSYFYQVVALTDDQSLTSNEVGKIDYAINRTAGAYSLIALPFASDTPVDAASLATHIGNVGSLLKWNPATQTFRFFAPPSIGDNFAVAASDVIFVSSAGSGTPYTTFIGKVERNEYNLTPNRYNFIAIPLQRSDLPTATAVATDLDNLASLLSWNTNTQAFRFFAVPNIGDNFSLAPGAPVIGQLTNQGPIRWPSDE